MTQQQLDQDNRATTTAFLWLGVVMILTIGGIVLLIRLMS